MQIARRLAAVGILATGAVLLASCSSSGSNAITIHSSVTAPSTAIPGSATTAASSATSASVPTIAPPPSISLTEPTSSTTSTPALPAAAVTAAPAFGTTGLSPAQQISVTVADGTISDFTLTNPDGKQVKGDISADGTTWLSGEVLGFGKTYTAAGTAVGKDGKNVPISGTFGTVSEDDEARITITPGDGDTVGIAQPIMIRFPVEPADKALIQKNLTITTDPQVEGAWAWVQHDEGWGVDWRPKDYWPANTKVHVEAKVYGLKLADGAYGASDLTTDFTIGRAQVVYGNVNEFQITVKQGCTEANNPDSCTSTVATYPASFGSGDLIGDPNRVTRSGVHVVNELLPEHKMSNPAYGYTDSLEYWDVRISNNGEFIHENPNTVGDQGSDNVSHGCVNLSPENAKAYFESAMLGDPVEITGSSVQLSEADGDIFDWTIDWNEWLNHSAL